MFPFTPFRFERHQNQYDKLGDFIIDYIQEEMKEKYALK
jgi:hypothetical protein